MLTLLCPAIHCYTMFYPPDLLTSLRNTRMSWKLVIEPTIQWEAPISIDQNFDKHGWYILLLYGTVWLHHTTLTGLHSILSHFHFGLLDLFSIHRTTRHLVLVELRSCRRYISICCKSSETSFSCFCASGCEISMILGTGRTTKTSLRKGHGIKLMTKKTALINPN